MRLDHVGADVEQLRDVRVGQAPGDGREDLLLPRREGRQGRTARQDAPDVGRDEGLPAGDRADRVDEFGEGDVLHDRAARAGRERVTERVRRPVRREDEDPGLRIVGENAPGRLDAVHVGHHEIHDDDVRIRLPRLADAALAVLRVADDREVGFRVDERGEAHAENGVVVDD